MQHKMHVNGITPLENLLPLICLSRAGWLPRTAQKRRAGGWAGSWSGLCCCAKAGSHCAPVPLPVPPVHCCWSWPSHHPTWPVSAIPEQHISSSCIAPLFCHPLFKEHLAVFMPPCLSFFLFRSEALTAFSFPFSPSSPWVLWKWLRKTVISQFMWHSPR